jgi:acetyl-CoA carboxylase biotin carboxyl carrier protein
MEYKEIQNLIKLIDSTNLSEFKMKEGEFELQIRTNDYFKLSKQMSSTVVSTPMLQTAPAPAPAVPQAPELASAPATSEPAAAEVPENTAVKLIDVKSPIVGTFYRSPAPDKDVFIKMGDRVEKGDIVCIVEAMKLFNEIESEVSGKVVEILVEDANPVEYDQVLFRLDPS